MIENEYFEKFAFLSGSKPRALNVALMPLLLITFGFIFVLYLDQEAYGQAGDVSSDTNNSSLSNSNFKTYDNVTYGIHLLYPQDWTIIHQIVAPPPNSPIISLVPPDVVSFMSQPQDDTDKFMEYVTIAIQNVSDRTLSLDSYLDKLVTKYRKAYTGFEPIKLEYSTSKVSLTGYPAYKLEYTENRYPTTTGNISDTTQPAEKFKHLETGTILGDKLYSITYIAESGSYDRFLPLIIKLIDSFLVTEPGTAASAESNLSNVMSNTVNTISQGDYSQAQSSNIVDLLDNGNLLYDQGRYEEAITYYDKALAIDPKNVDALNNKVNALDSIADYLRASGRHKEAIELYDKALAIDPKNVDTLRQKAYVFVELRQYEDAIQNYDKALAIDPNDVWTILDKANTLRDSGRYEEAIDSFDKALSINSTFIFALDGKAAVLSDLRRYEEAITYYDKALALKPDDVWTLRDKAFAFRDLGRYEEALALLDKALEVSPIFSDDYNDKNTVMNLYNDKGVLLDELGRHTEAITYYDKALAIEPSSLFTLNNKGLALYHLGNFEEALRYYDKALALDPNDVDALNNKAVAEANLTPDFKPVLYDGMNFDIGRYVFITTSINNDSAIPDVKTPFDRALELKPDDTKILVNTGKYLADKLGKYEVAIVFFDRALKIDFNYVPALVNKGGCLEKLGSHEGAQELFDKAKQLDPTYENKFITAPPKTSNALPSPI